MPIYEALCETCRTIEEFYARTSTAPDPPCPVCLGPRTRLASRFAVVFTGPLTTRYNDPSRDNSHMEGFWAYRKVGTLSGNPEPVFIGTHQELKEYCKTEGLYHPSEVPRNLEISRDGRRLLSNGMPGQWAASMPAMPSRLRELVTKPIEEFHEPSASVASNQSRMPMTGGTVPVGEMERIRRVET